MRRLIIQGPGRTRVVLFALLAAGSVAVYASAVALATPSASLTTTILAKSVTEEMDLNAHTTPADLWHAQLKTHGLSDVYVVDNKIAPHGSTGWHSHPGPSLILVVAGTVTNYIGDDRARPACTPHVYSAGMSFVDEGGSDVHILRNEGTVPAETIAVQILPKDAARRIDALPPGNCPF